MGGLGRGFGFEDSIFSPGRPRQDELEDGKADQESEEDPIAEARALLADIGPGDAQAAADKDIDQDGRAARK